MFRSGSFFETQATLDAIGTAVALFSDETGPTWHLVSGNRMFADGFGLDLTRVIDQPLSVIFPRYMANELEAACCQSRDETRALELEQAFDRAGRTYWWRIIATPILLEDGSVRRVLLTMLDITAKKSLQLELDASRKRYEALVDAAYDGVISVDMNQRIRMMNASARQMFQVDEAIVGEHLDRLLPERFHKRHDEMVAGFRHSPILSRPMQLRSPVVGRRSDGGEFPLEVTLSKIRVGEAQELTAVVRDLTEQVRMIEELRVAATRDCLTGLSNRRRIDEIAQNEFIRADRFEHELAILLIDIDHFKAINDAHGHQSGDRVLQSVAQRIRGATRMVDFIGRWGGEEFLVVLPESSLDNARLCAERIREFVHSKPHGIDAAAPIRATVSVGVTARHGPEDTLHDMFLRADAALYAAKDLGRNRVAIEARPKRPTARPTGRP